MSRLASRVTIAVVLLALAAVPRTPVALADGDPASDVLAQESLFLPQDAAIPPRQQTQLADLIQTAARGGYTIRVALIASSADLGSVTELWGQPQNYAKFLGQELSLVYHGRLLVVMPNGLGLYHSESAATERAAIAGLPSSGRTGLGAAALTAVQRLTAASGHPIAIPNATTSPIWRGWCQGVGVEGHGVVGVAGAVVAVREAAEAFAGFATFGHAHIRGLSQDLCSSHVRCLKSSAPTRGWVLRRRIAELCARAGMPRTASPTATGCQSVSVFVSASL